MLLVRCSWSYNLDFIKSDDFKNLVKNIITENPDYSLEMILFFLVDTLAKTEFRFKAGDEQEEALQKKQIEKIIQEKKLNKNLINTASQLPVVLTTVKRYLEIWREESVK